VARVKEELRRMLLYYMTGVKIRSRQNEYAEEEKGSIYHYNKELKGSSSNNLAKLRYTNEEGVEEVTEDVKKIENLLSHSTMPCSIDAMTRT
jgi:ATP-dependent Zn protease